MAPSTRARARQRRAWDAVHPPSPRWRRGTPNSKVNFSKSQQKKREPHRGDGCGDDKKRRAGVEVPRLVLCRSKQWSRYRPRSRYARSRAPGLGGAHLRERRLGCDPEGAHEYLGGNRREALERVKRLPAADRSKRHSKSTGNGQESAREHGSRNAASGQRGGPGAATPAKPCPACAGVT